jgi:hypothetical protein
VLHALGLRARQHLRLLPSGHDHDHYRSAKLQTPSERKSETFAVSFPCRSTSGSAATIPVPVTLGVSVKCKVEHNKFFCHQMICWLCWAEIDVKTEDSLQCGGECGLLAHSACLQVWTELRGPNQRCRCGAGMPMPMSVRRKRSRSRSPRAA